MVHTSVGPHVLSHGLQHVSHFPCEDEVTLMSCGVAEDGFLSLHRSGCVRFYTSDGSLKAPPTRNTVPYKGVAFTHVPGRLVGWGGGEKLTLLDTNLTPLAHAQDELDIRVCQMLEGSRELVTAGAGNVCVWSLGHMVCRVCVVDGFEGECVFTQLALIPGAAQKAPRALAVCGRSVSVVDLKQGSVLENRTNLHRREITALVYCPLQDVVVTASKDVIMRVWGSHWELLTTCFMFLAVVTSLLLCPMSGLLLSSSLDCTLRYWSLQTGDQVKILTPPTGSAPPLSVGGPSSASTFFSFSTSNVDFWTFNRLYELHCKLREDSDVRPVRQILATPPGPHYPSRVVCVHGESDVTLVAAGTGEVITAFRGGVRVRCADYCLYREVLMVLTEEGAVIKASTLTNPGTLLSTWTNRENGRGKACCMAIYCHVVDEETLLEEWKNTPVCVSLLDSLLAIGLQQQHSATYSLLQLHFTLYFNSSPESSSRGDVKYPASLSLTEFCALLLEFLKRCGMDQKQSVLKAIITLHTHNSLNNTHTITHSLLDTLHTCLQGDMSDLEQHFAVELLNFLVCVNPHSFDITVEILLLLADKQLRLQGVAVCMLQALGVGNAHQWLLPQLESWILEAQKHADPQSCLRESAHRWLNSWTEKYKIYKSAGRKSAVVSKVISPAEVLRYFCWVQQEAQVRPRDRNDTVRLDTQHYRWKAVHRLGETNSMTRVRELRGPCFPPLTSRSPLVPGFTRLLSLPLPRVTGSSFPFALEVQCLKQAPRQRYFLLERSYVQT